MIKRNILRIQPQNIDKTIHFYSNLLGMKYEQSVITKHLYLPKLKNNNLHEFYYEPDETSTRVTFIEDRDFKTSYQNSGYWKIGIGLHDVNAAVKFLREHDVIVGEAQQFLDVGFLTSCQDPNGYSIELLQHDFEKNFKALGGGSTTLNQPVQVMPHIGQITLRNKCQQTTNTFYSNVLSMKLLCVERLSQFVPFDLYFYAYSDKTPPNSDLSAVENREWLYRQQFTQIEFQHRLNLKSDFKYLTNDEQKNQSIGHVGIELLLSQSVFDQVVASNYYAGESMDNAFPHRIYDPDGYLFFIKRL